MIRSMFETHGRICACHPYEVIVSTLTLAICLLSMECQFAQRITDYKPITFEQQGIHVLLMTLLRCLAILYGFHKFKMLYLKNSKPVISLAILFTISSSFLYTYIVLGFMKGNFADVRDGLFLFLVVLDLSKASSLAQFALRNTNIESLVDNISRGMGVMGPSLTLDTLVKTLVISVGTLSAVPRLEMLSYFGCLSILINYVMFMTLYPASLALIMQLMHRDRTSQLVKNKLQQLEEQKSNPLIQRVKLIMSGGLVLVHVHSRWFFLADDNTLRVSSTFGQDASQSNTTDSDFQSSFLRWLTVSADQLALLIILGALAIKYLFFEASDQQLVEQLTLEEKDLPVVEVTSNSCSVQFQLGDESDSETEAPTTEDQAVQTDVLNHNDCFDGKTQLAQESPCKPRPLNEIMRIFNSPNHMPSSLTDEEMVQLVENNIIPLHNLENSVRDIDRGIRIRRRVLAARGNMASAIDALPFWNFDYSNVMGVCCDNCIGFMPVPVGVAGPLKVNGKFHYVPMATTEGCLIASVNRGCAALRECGVKSEVLMDGMSRGPVVRYPSVQRASEVLQWLKEEENYLAIKQRFESSSRFAQLQKLEARVAGRMIFLRFISSTGDAMGMNMVTKATQFALHFLQEELPDTELLSVSGNYCSDKKSAAINWIQGRGKWVVCEAVIPSKVLERTLKISAKKIIELHIAKNFVGSAMAGALGGFNAHASNIVTAIYIATGQDAAQNVTSSNCIVMMEPWGKDGNDLNISCTMPSIEIGTHGGGTNLPAQSACLEMMGVKGFIPEEPGRNARTLASIVCGAVLAGEVSLMAALGSGDLVKSHMRLNRSKVDMSRTDFLPNVCQPLTLTRTVSMTDNLSRGSPTTKTAEESSLPRRR